MPSNSETFPNGGTSWTAKKLAFFDALNKSKELKHLDCRIAWQILHYWNYKTGVAWPSMSRLAQEVGCARRSAIRSIGNLEKKEWFYVTERGGPGRSNRYAPNFEKARQELSKNTDDVTPAAPSGDSSAPGMVTQLNAVGVSFDTTMVTPVSQESFENNPIKESTNLSPTAETAMSVAPGGFDIHGANSPEDEEVVFRGELIILSRREYKVWKETFHAIPDLKAELLSLDSYFQKKLTGAERQDWKTKVSSLLNKKHQEWTKKSTPRFPDGVIPMQPGGG